MFVFLEGLMTNRAGYIPNWSVMEANTRHQAYPRTSTPGIGIISEKEPDHHETVSYVLTTESGRAKPSGLPAGCGIPRFIRSENQNKDDSPALSAINRDPKSRHKPLLLGEQERNNDAQGVIS